MAAENTDFGNFADSILAFYGQRKQNKLQERAQDSLDVYRLRQLNQVAAEMAEQARQYDTTRGDLNRQFERTFTAGREDRKFDETAELMRIGVSGEMADAQNKMADAQLNQVALLLQRYMDELGAAESRRTQQQNLFAQLPDLIESTIPEPRRATFGERLRENVGDFFIGGATQSGAAASPVMGVLNMLIGGKIAGDRERGNEAYRVSREVNKSVANLFRSAEGGNIDINSAAGRAALSLMNQAQGMYGEIGRLPGGREQDAERSYQILQEYINALSAYQQGAAGDPGLTVLPLQ